MSRPTFVVACLSGRALLTDIDDWVQAWHESTSPDSLDEYLGLSHEEGKLFAERPEALRFIMAARRNGHSVQDELRRRDDSALAARANNSDAAIEVLAWLRDTGRID